MKTAAVIIFIAAAIPVGLLAFALERLDGLQRWASEWRDLAAERLQEGDCSRAIGVKKNDSSDKDDNAAYYFYSFVQLVELIRECCKITYIMLVNAGIVFYLALQNLLACWK